MAKSDVKAFEKFELSGEDLDAVLKGLDLGEV